MGYDHLRIETKDQVGWLWLDRPDRRNALTWDMWEQIPQAVAQLGSDERVRVVVVAGRGSDFTVGIDLELLASLAPEGPSEADRNRQVYTTIKRMQATMSAFEACPKPVVAAIHGYCLGAGVDLVTAVDIRLAAADTVLGVRETKLAIVADVGTLQRLPRIVGPGHAAELVYTGRDVDAARALEIGLVNRMLPDTQSLHAAAGDLAAEIASNSPLAVEGSKAMLRAAGRMQVDEALEQVALWNAAFLRSNDAREALSAFATRRPPEFTGT